VGEIGEPASPTIDVAPKQVAISRTGAQSMYVLGSDAIQQIDLTNTAPPPQGGAVESDVISLIVMVLLLALVGLAVLSRLQRRRVPALAASLGASLEGPIRLDAKNGAQRQQQQPGADEDLLVAHQAKGE
jgi:hypothetical protein